jgi:ATP-dependent helicase/nuclease subunit B
LGIRPVVLLIPSQAAAIELPRRLANTGRAVTGLLAFKLLDLARALAEPTLLGSGREAWHSGHGALLAARLLPEAADLALPPELPRRPAALALARTLGELRAARVGSERIAALATSAEVEDAARLGSLALLLRRYNDVLDGQFADPSVVLRTAAARVAETAWLKDAEVLVVDDLELDAGEKEFLAALARALPVKLLERSRPASLARSGFGAWGEKNGIASVAWSDTVLAPLAPAAPPAGLARLCSTLFETPSGAPPADSSVDLVTAPGEAAEVRAIARRVLREAARGVPFEEIGIVLPRPEEYASLFADVFEAVRIPYRLHPSLPLRFGRTARSLMLLFACRGLQRSAVMEFLTFAQIPYATILGEEAEPRVAAWDALSRDARIVSGLERWIVGLRAHAEAEREAAETERDAERRARRLGRASDCENLLRVVELLSTTLDGLAGRATWRDWSQHLQGVLEDWVAPDADREEVVKVLADLSGLGAVAGAAAVAPWREVEEVLLARFEWERLPLRPVTGGAIHVGAFDAMAGLRLRVIAIPGLVEGGYPGVIRPDPFLLDVEREALAPSLPKPPAPGAASRGQLLLFESAPARAEEAPVERPLATTQDRILEARRLFHRAIGQATERLILSYPRADPRSGRERLPSLFFVAAATAREGRTLSLAELQPLVHEDDLKALPLEDAVDGAERDRVRVLQGGELAAQAIAAGSAFFRQSRLAQKARWGDRLSAYDGFLAPLPAELYQQLDPVLAKGPVSASRLALFSTCGFKYMLENVLKLSPVIEPEERRRLEPVERGSLFHDVAERFLRERRERGELPLRATDAMRERLREMGDGALQGLVAGSPPRFTLLWERERARFHETLDSWLEREAAAEGSTPAHFEVPFGLSWPPPPGEPFSTEPLLIELGDGRTLRVSGKIDRIDKRDDGTLVLRDYKTGRAPRDDGGIYRGGKQLQIPFYILAAQGLWPGQPVTTAFLDYVDGGRQVSFDPETVTGEGLRSLLRSLVDAIAQGLFVQDPGHCDFCDYTAVCGPKGLVERRRAFKLRDPRLQRVLRFKDVL